MLSLWILRFSYRLFKAKSSLGSINDNNSFIMVLLYLYYQMRKSKSLINHFPSIALILHHFLGYFYNFNINILMRGLT